MGGRAFLRLAFWEARPRAAPVVMAGRPWAAPVVMTGRPRAAPVVMAGRPRAAPVVMDCGRIADT